MTKRRTPSQWQSLVEQQAQSGQSVPKFCSEQSISSASFYKWRQRLGASGLSAASQSTPSFIDLSTLSSDHAQQSETDKPWHIVLSLGNGVELRLSQH
ncbi:MAG: transposase [Saccharospirillum sp.]|uniref:IS66 family insertion sequence element accessory protein TnpA n=1 Tax=Saccharospirillum sp. TaxID=2033801 RepID=UPI0034A016BE